MTATLTIVSIVASLLILGVKYVFFSRGKKQGRMEIENESLKEAIKSDKRANKIRNRNRKRRANQRMRKDNAD